MNNLNHMFRYSESVYAAKIRKFSNLEKLLDERLDFDSFSFNSWIRYLESGDAIHINRVLEAAKHLSRYREIQGMLRGHKLVAHSWTSGPAPMLDVRPGAKSNKKQFRTLREQGESAYLFAYGSEQGKQSKSRGFDLQKRLESFLVAAAKHGHGLDDVQNVLIAANTAAQSKIRKQKQAA